MVGPVISGSYGERNPPWIRTLGLQTHLLFLDMIDLGMILFLGMIVIKVD